MRQVLIVIPLHEWIGQLHPWLNFLPDIPIYVYGMMLFFAFIFCNALARRLFRREGFDDSLVLDLLIWLFVSGIAGARIVYIIQYWHTFATSESYVQMLIKMISLWDGGLVFYGSIFGGAIGYFVYYYRVLRKHHITHWKMLDIIACCIPLGLALGRVGCLFTGCCFGNVACYECPAIHFPLNSPPTIEMIRRGYQSPLGFLLKDDTLTVAAVEPGSSAADAGLLPGDVIQKVNGKVVLWPESVWRMGGDVQLTVNRDGVTTDLPAFTPTSIGVHPTQIYESISMSLLLFFLLSYYPYRRRDGELMVLLMFGYGVHRFLNEMLRTDTAKVAFDLTLSQNISLLVLASGVVLACLVWRRPLTVKTGTSDPITSEPAA